MHLLAGAVKLLLVSAGTLAIATPALRHSHNLVPASNTPAKRTDGLCQFNPFFCDLGVATPNAFHFDYSTLAFGPVPPGTTGNPATNTFCVGNTCSPNGTVSIEIRGSSCDNIGASDPTVIITFPALDGLTYTQEHIYVGPTSDAVPNNAGSFDFISPTYCTTNVSPATCTIPLSVFLNGAGISSPCADGASHTFNIVTHGSLSSGTGTSVGTCIKLNNQGNCAPFFAYGTITYKCSPCTVCSACPCPAYTDAHKCDCVPGYPAAHPCECTPTSCACPTYAAANKCICNPDCTCPAYAAAHKCECSPDCSCPDYSAAHKCECTPDCTCPDYAAAHKCECNPDCTCPAYAADHKCECNPDCSCPDYSAAHKCECTPDCTCPDYAASHKCQCNPDCGCPEYAAANKCLCAPDCTCADYAATKPCECAPTTCACPTYAASHQCQCNPDYPATHKCECNPDCSCPDYAAAHPDVCFKWCPDVDTCYGYFEGNPAYQSQFNKASVSGKTLPNKNCQSKWGWWDSFTVSQLTPSTSYTGKLVAGAGNYNLAAGYTAGSFTLSVGASGELLFSFTSSSPDIQFGVFHVQASCSVPSTCAPGQFDNTYTRTLGSSAASSGSGLSITTLPSGCMSTPSTYVYFIFHGSVAKRIPASQTCPAAAPQ